MMNRRKFVALSATTAFGAAAFVSGCSQSSAENKESTVEETTQVVPEEQDLYSVTGTGAVLVVSFGTSYNESRAKTISAIEADVAAAIPDFDQRRAFTSQIIIDKLMDRDGLQIDSVAQAMDRLVQQGYKRVVVQPTHIMHGEEYTDILNTVCAYDDKFESLVVGRNVLDTDADFEPVMDILVDSTQEYAGEGKCVVWMGHGTEADSNGVYQQMDDLFISSGHPDYVMGTVEATPTCQDAINRCLDQGVSAVTLFPFMIVAGDHANNDMAGDEEGSWKTQFKAAGFDVDCVIQGLGENADFRQRIVKKALEAKDQL